MLKYILKRLLVFIPTLVIISLLAFVISINSPADPVEQLARAANTDGNVDTESSAGEKIKNEIREKLGLDLPVFYFSINTLGDCDTLRKITNKAHRDNLKALSRTYGNWEEINAYFQSVNALLSKHQALSPDSIYKNVDSTKISLEEINENYNNAIFTALSLQEVSDTSTIHYKLNELDAIYNLSYLKAFSNELSNVKLAYSKMLSSKSTWKNYIPIVKLNGFNNQYHIWLLGDLFTGKTRHRQGVLRGDFGYSYSDNQPVLQKIKDKFLYSFILVVISIVIAYLVSIPLGIYSAYKKGSLVESTSSVVVFMLYSLPSFFIGTWLLYVLSNPDNLMWFPTGGVKDPSVFDDNWSFWQKLKHQAPYFVLPIITYTYSSFAFISRIMKVSMTDVLSQDYIRTAKAKGLPNSKILFKHALKNALLPIITMFADIFPAAVGGSVILETIFSIPGMGFEIYHAVLGTDIPMIVAVFTITGVLTVIGYLVSDILYAIVDPRISYKS